MTNVTLDKLISDFYAQANSTGSNPTPEHMLTYFKNLLQLYEEKLIDEKELSYSIGATLQFELPEKLHKIALDGGELELPDHHISGNVDERYTKFLESLRDL